MRQDFVDHALLCVTNDGKFYDRCVKNALYERKGGYPLNGQNTTATVWVSIANSFATAAARVMGNPLDAQEILALALALSAYYAEHMEEWDPLDRAAKAKALHIA